MHQPWPRGILFWIPFFLCVWHVNSVRACDRSEIVLDSIVPAGLEHDIYLTLCVGGGVTGANQGGGSNTTNIFFAFYSCLDSLRFSYFTPSITADTTGETLIGTNFGPVSSGPLQNQGLIQYISPTSGDFMCISNVADCGYPHTQCFSMRFRVDAIPDSLKVLGLEGNGNPLSGCSSDPDNTIRFDATAFPCTDTDAPSITCPAPQNSANCLVGDYRPLTTVSDNLDPFPSLSQSPTPGSGLFAAPTAITLTATDWLGNSSSCTFNVFIDDTIPPQAICQPHSVYLDTTGQASILVTDVDNGSIDGCGIALLTLSQSTFDCSQVGPNVVELVATDFQFNNDTCTSTVMVLDTGVSLELGADTLLCDGSSLMLNAGPGSIYQWNSGAGTQTITVSSAGVYAVTITSDAGCSSSDSIAVSTSNSPVSSFSMGSGASNFEIVLSDLSSGDVTGWLWDFGDGGTSTQQHPSHMYAMPGTYTVCLVAYGPCGADTSCQSTTITSSGPPLNGAVLSVFPNPTSGGLWLNRGAAFSGDIQLRIFDAQGRMVRSMVMEEGREKERMEMGEMANGIYHLQYTAGELRGSVKVVVAR